MSELQGSEAFEELVDTLAVLHNLGATGVINFAGYEFGIGRLDTSRENHLGTNSPYVRLLGSEAGLPADTPVITDEDFHNYVKDFHSYDIKSPNGWKSRAGNAWTYDATFENHERGRLNWSVWSDEAQIIRGVDPQKVIDFFAPYETLDAVPTEGLTLGPGPKKIWYSFAQHLAVCLR